MPHTVNKAINAKLSTEQARDRGLHYRRHWTRKENKEEGESIEDIEKIRRERQFDYNDVAKE